MRTVNRPTHAAISLVVGILSGLFLGFMFAPDPTGLLPLVYGLVLATPITGYLYWVGLPSRNH